MRGQGVYGMGVQREGGGGGCRAVLVGGTHAWLYMVGGEIVLSARACMFMCMCARRVLAEAGMWRMIHVGMQRVKRC